MRLGVHACRAMVLALSGCGIRALPPPKPIERRAVSPSEQSTVIVAVPATFDTNVMTGRQCENPMVVQPLAYGEALRLVKAEGGNVFVVYRDSWPAIDTEGDVYGKHVRCPEAVLAGLRSKGRVNEP